MLNKMPKRPNKRSKALRCVAGMVGSLVLAGGVQADSTLVSPVPDMYAVTEPQRLSAWLGTHPAAQTQVLHWRTDTQHKLQQALKVRLIHGLKGRFSALASALAEMPVTGRVPLPNEDGRWLEVNPSFDPLLQRGDVLVGIPRSAFVSMLLPSGYLCRVPHRSGADIMAYVRACEGLQPSHAWVVQPDGAVIRQDVAAWNEGSQVEPAPGAWLWAPEPADAVSTEESEALARFLATQAEPLAGYVWTRSRQLDAGGQQAVDGVVQRPRGLHVGSNDWGAIGLLQTPTARMEQVGSASLNYNRTVPYASLKARLQPVEWLSFDLGYVSISDRRYGPAALSGDQSYKDKSADVKLRLWRETAWLPEVAVGWRDLIGTGFFASEYIVAGKRFGDLDLNAGLTFGYMAGRQNVSNPFGWLSSRFKTRPAPDVGAGGRFNGDAYFRGRAAFFGGLQYQLPFDKWLVKLEYEGNDYSHEPSGRPIQQHSPFNVGVVYRYAPWLDLSAGLERGNRAMFTVSARTQLDGLRTPKYLDPRRVPVKNVYPAGGTVPAVQTARDIEAQADVSVRRITSDGLRMTVTLRNPDASYQRAVIDKVAAVAHRDASAEVEKIAVRVEQQGVPVAEVEVDRQQWVRERTQYLPPEGRDKPSVRTLAVREADAGSEPAYDDKGASNSTSAGLAMYYRQNLGGPDSFLLYQLGVDLNAQWSLRPDTWLAGVTRLRVLDNYHNYRYTASSNLPRVRTYLREYLVTERLTVPNLQLSHMGQAGAMGDHFYLLYGGLLESMFAGVGGEYLWRPVNSRLALGVDVNHVRQRDFEQRLSLRDYKVNTGHLTAYWDTGVSDVLLKLSAGQYLAGDKGVTIDASRVFRNGVAIGAYATKTNVSAAQFGEGSFDKGVYVSIPFDAMLPKSGAGQASIVYAPLIRDGGAKLGRRFTLFEMTRLRDPRALDYGDGGER